MIVHWKLWVDCTTEASARTVAARVHALAFPMSPPVTVKPYERGGFVVTWAEPNSSGWNDAVVETIRAAQKIGAGWVLTGDILSAPEGVLSKNAGGHIAVSGATMVSWLLLREGPAMGAV
ncbi:MAG: hypothetical protein IPI67_35830 [Myxococcales bacterium]|nr:hypothetical protein [Myxococcales bacterium]